VTISILPGISSFKKGRIEIYLLIKDGFSGMGWGGVEGEEGRGGRAGRRGPPGRRR
jgi:hypothetical protein